MSNQSYQGKKNPNRFVRSIKGFSLLALISKAGVSTCFSGGFALLLTMCSSAAVDERKYLAHSKEQSVVVLCCTRLITHYCLKLAHSRDMVHVINVQ